MTKQEADSQPNQADDASPADVESPTPAEGTPGDGGIEQELETKGEEKAVVEVAEVVEGDSSNEGGEEKGKNDKKVHMKVSADAPWSERMWEVFSTFWPLGLVAFGGPQVKFFYTNFFSKNDGVCVFCPVLLTSNEICISFYIFLTSSPSSSGPCCYFT